MNVIEDCWQIYASSVLPPTTPPEVLARRGYVTMDEMPYDGNPAPMEMPK